MLRRYAAIFFLIPQASAVAAQVRANDSCTVSHSQRGALLALPFTQFDQQQGNGWRPLYANKCYTQAASLLKEYVQLHPDTARQQFMLPFHTGQMFALAGQSSEAITWMQKGYSKIASDQINWNAFVDATIAFLKQDYNGLLKQRSIINQEPPLTNVPGVPAWAIGKKMNLDVVDGYIACFRKPYDVAYGDACRQQGAKLAY